ncbi:hypothetical protein GCM10010123_20430 [Pilimelia anulata]|uniref:L-threonylcarbamoyladenylate synthase n=1 Tax=Pilimelia anulata TaxID=53371 RepID=A0A8J3B267_9ACTN|nr:Sua5/YciO/YrdC/YwlC family protein [Pilimelia anulata]GGJ90516.1 hypothetical protein GCM10010123_20430 [Pilimelia anulata]
MKTIPERDLAVAAAALDAGRIVIVPTARWYMICADATNPTACQTIFTTKHRPTSKSMVYIAPTAARALATFQLNAAALALADEFWPGDLALLLPWRPDTTPLTAVGCEHALVTVAPGVLGRIAAAAARPIAATTVNISGPITAPGPAITAKQAADFVHTTGIDVAYLIDGGTSPLANHLTIVDCTQPAPRTVRPGVIHQRAVDATLQTVTDDQAAT